MTAPIDRINAPLALSLIGDSQPQVTQILWSLNLVEATNVAVIDLNQPIVLHYAESDWQNAGIVDEESLNLYYWDGHSWVALLPCAGCSHDPVNNIFTVRLDQATFAALQAVRAQKLYLPLVAK